MRIRRRRIAGHDVGNSLRSRLRRHAAGFREMIEAAAIVAKPHGVGPQFDDEVMQLRGRHEGFDVVPARPAGPLGIAKDLAPASGQQALGRGGENVRDARRDVFDRLEQDRLRLGETLADA